MVLERYRTEADVVWTPLARISNRLGLSANAITVISLLFAVAAGVLFYFASPARWGLLIAGSACVSVNAILDAIDGKLARLTGTESRRGDYLDHVVDRYSDLTILVGLTLSAFANVNWGIAAIAGTFLTSYMGTQAQALGLGRNYRGFLGRADRLVILIGAPVVQAAAVLFPTFDLGFATWITLTLAYFAIVGNLTAIQRFWHGWKELA